MSEYAQVVVPEPSPDTFEGMKEMDQEKRHAYEVIRAEANAGIAGQVLHENFARLLRLLCLRETKAKLAPMHLWGRWCADAGLNIVRVDDDLEKLGKAPKDLLVKFGSFTDYDMNKINKLTKGNFQNLEDSGDDAHIVVDGKRIPLVKDEIEYVVGCIQDNVRKAEEKAARAEANAEDADKKVRSAENALKRFKGKAEANGRTPAEEGFFQQMTAIKKEFDELLARMKPEYSKKLSDTTISEGAALEYKGTISYMKQRIIALETGITAE